MQRRRQHETMDLSAPQVVDQRVPILVKTFQRVAVFVQRGAIELRQAMGVSGEMCWDPVENDADIRLVAGIDEGAKLIR